MKLSGTYNQCGRWKQSPDDCRKFKRNKHGCAKCSGFMLYGWNHGVTIGGHRYDLYPATGFAADEDDWQAHYKKYRSSCQSPKVSKSE